MPGRDLFLKNQMQNAENALFLVIVNDQTMFTEIVLL